MRVFGQPHVFGEPLGRSAAAGGGVAFDYFVNGATGNDTTGDGLTPETAWKTIDKAISSVPLAGGVTIGVAAGTYAENSGGLNYLYISRQFTDWVIVRAMPGASVTITDNASGTFCVRYAGGQRVRFSAVTIQQAGTNNQGTVVLANGAIADFVNCTITNRNWSIYTAPTGAVSFSVSSTVLQPRTGETGICLAIYADAFSGGSITATLNNVTATSQSPSGNSTGVLFRKFQADALQVTATITGGTFTNDNGYALSCYGGQLGVNGATFVSSGAPALVFGTDDAATHATTGSVKNCTIASDTSHALLIGQGTDGVEASNNVINAGDIGAVIKGANIVFDGNTVTPGTSDTLLLKGCSSPVVTNNTLQASAAGKFCLSMSLQGTTKVSSVTFTGNILEASGAADCMMWAGSTIDAGSGVCDSNTYDYSASSGNVGDVRTATGITDLAGLQAAWSGYGDGTNDANSTVIAA